MSCIECLGWKRGNIFCKKIFHVSFIGFFGFCFFFCKRYANDLTIKVVVFVSRDSWFFGLVKSVPFFGSQGFLSKSSSHSQAKRQTSHNAHDLFMLERLQRNQVEYILHFIMYMAIKWPPLFRLSSQLTYEIKWHETSLKHREINIWETKLFLNSIYSASFQVDSTFSGNKSTLWLGRGGLMNESSENLTMKPSFAMALPFLAVLLDTQKSWRVQGFVDEKVFHRVLNEKTKNLPINSTLPKTNMSPEKL